MKKRFAEGQITGFLREDEAGRAVAEVCRRPGLSEASSCLWRSQFGSLKVSDDTRLKGLEADNRRLNRLLAETTMENVLARSLGKKW